MSAPIIPNETAAAMMSCGDLGFALTVLSLTSGKDRNYVFILSRTQNFKPHRQAL